MEEQPASPAQRHATPIVYGYFVMMLTLAVLPEKLASTPIKFLYMEQLHLDAETTAMMGFIVTIPGYLAFAFGLLRDRFNPLNMGDRGYILLFGCLTGLVFLELSQLPLTLATLVVSLLLVTASQQLLRAAYQALMRNIAEVRLMSGRMSTTYQFMATALPMLATVTGGWLADNKVSWRIVLMAVGAGYIALGVFGRWKPQAVFDDVPLSGSPNAANFRKEVGVLLKRRAFWIAAIIWGVWAFSPGANTPIQYYMTNTLHMSKTEYSLYDGLTTFTLVPTVLLFGILIKRFSLRPLLWIATAAAIPQMIPLMLIHNAPQAYGAATFMGLTGGLANAAYWSLVIRASPHGLAGTGMLMAISLGHIAVQGSDVLGGWLFKHWGFAGCAVATTAVYLLLVPLIALTPAEIVDPADDEAVKTG